MEVKVVIEVGHVEVVDGRGVTAWDMGIPHLLSYDTAVFALDQGIVVGPPGARFGLFDEECIEEFGNAIIDKFRSVVGMKAQDSERKTRQEFFHQRFQEDFGNAFDSAHDLPLRDFVNDVDVIDTLGFVSVALMDGIHTQVPWATVGGRLLSCADVTLDGLSLGQDQSAPLVMLSGAEVVEVCHRNVFESQESLIPVDVKGPLKQRLGGRTGKALMNVVCLDQECNVIRCITPAETVACGTVHFDVSTPSLAGDESRDLGIGVTGDALSVAFEDSFLFFAMFEIAKPL